MFAIFGLSLILLGLFHLTARDLMWRFHAWGKRAEGVVQVERTPEWDTMQTFHGTILVLMGLVVWVVGCQVGDRAERPRHKPGHIEWRDVPPQVRKQIEESQSSPGQSGR